MEQGTITSPQNAKGFNRFDFLTFKIITTFIFLIILSSCSKDNDDNKKSNKKDLLTAAPWKVVAAVVNPAYNIDGTGEISDLYSLYEACDKDDMIIFKPNGDMIFDEGATKCDADDPQSEVVGKWELRNNDTELYAEGIDDNNVVQILELTESTLKVKWTEVDDNISYTYQETLTH